MNKYVYALSLGYKEYVVDLKKSHGKAERDYFSRESYDRFMAGEIQSLSTQKNVTRTAEGLYCHHVAENRETALSNPENIRAFNLPFEYQEARNLVYCDIIEHAILHILIAVEKRNDEAILGLRGYTNAIRPEIIDWFIKEQIPEKPWRKRCYDAIELRPRDVEKLLNFMDKFLTTHYPIDQSYLDLAYEAYHLSPADKKALA